MVSTKGGEMKQEIKELKTRIKKLEQELTEARQLGIRGLGKAEAYLDQARDCLVRLQRKRNSV